MHQFQTMEEEKFVASRKCTLQKTECSEPYWKKPRLTQFPLLEIQVWFQIHSPNLKGKTFFGHQSVPMWTGWNTRKHTKTSPQQLVCYIGHIQLHPTRADIVKKTLKHSQVVAEEYRQKYALVTYDLASVSKQG